MSKLKRSTSSYPVQWRNFGAEMTRTSCPLSHMRLRVLIGSFAILAFVRLNAPAAMALAESRGASEGTV